jgi:GNAT superfamily N-acetyltransferase
MYDHMPVRFQFDNRAIDWRELERLFKVSGLENRTGCKLRTAFENSAVSCFAHDDTCLIGAGRALSDFEYHATIYDVIVHPDFQRRGVGSRIMNELLKRLPVWRGLLVADAEASGFYARLGFNSYGDVMARFEPTKLNDLT